MISTHCHNDLGLAVANSLAGVEAGARQVECTINGLGERAGNAALEEIVMALRTRADYYGVGTRIQTQRLCPISRLVSNITGMAVQRNKAIVGQNAFAHEAGIHQDGILKARATYEIIKPEDVGYIGENLILGKHSGRHAVRDRLKKLGYELPDDDFQQVYNDLIALADKKKNLYDADLIALVEHRPQTGPEKWKLVRFQTVGGTGTMPTATIEVIHTETGPSDQITEKRVFGTARGEGPLDAVFQCLNQITGQSVELKDYSVRSVTSGHDAQGEASVVLTSSGATYHGKGVSTDVIEASALAYLQALNKITPDALRPVNEPGP